MVMKQPTPPLDTQSTAENGVRKRVCKACDRCRLKKSKCDGANPCGRCRSDNAICVFGERKKAHDKVYPKGYVEMLEQQQNQLVAGLQELYRRTQEGEGWPGEPLKKMTNGHPLTHDILERLGVLKPVEGSDTIPTFEEDLNLVQRKLIASGAGFVHRDNSSDFGSEGAPSPTIPTSNPFGASVSEMPYPITSSPVAAGAGAGAGGAMGSPMDLDMSMGMSFPPTPPLYSHQPHFPQQRNKRLTPTQQAQISAAQARIFNLPQHGAAHQHHHQQSPPTSAGSMTSGSSSRSQSQQHEPNTMLKSPRKRLSTEDHQAPLPPSQPPMFFNHSSMNPNLLQQTHTQSAPMPIPSNTSNEQWQSATAATPLTPMSALSVSPANITSNPLASPSEPLMNAGMPPNLDDCVDFIDSFDAFNAFSPSSSYSGMPDWKEDDDLKLFLNPNPGVL